MRKKELIALHQLLTEVRETLESRGEVGIEAYEEYDSLEIGPHHVHCDKAEHEEAIWALFEAHENTYGDDDESESYRRIVALRS